jgi:predicted ATPase/Tfp pilus assembly protein PilF/DNA-binding XRE family transcriptional regulator
MDDVSTNTVRTRQPNEILRQERLLRGWSQREVGDRVGTDSYTVNRWERGRAVPSPYFRQKLCELYAKNAHHLGLMTESAPSLHLSSTPDPTPAPASTPTLAPAFTPTPPLRDHMTSFIGREEEIAALQELFSSIRQLTLTGPGGCGKTRLGIHLANSISHQFAGEVWYIELATISQPAQIEDLLLRTLGCSTDDHHPLQSLLAFLRPRSALLLIDNCEHLIDACAHLIETLLRECPSLKVLATSREILTLASETIWRVRPLSFPPDLSTTYDIQQLQHYASVRLFVERAQHVAPDFALTPLNAGDIAHICIHLDGLPLAIELAAATIKMFSIEQIAASVEHSFSVFARGSRTALPRQQTLLATMHWSYQLLTEQEQQLFRRLAVFRTTFSLQEVAGVCLENECTQTALIPLFAALIDKSLVTVLNHGTENRYRLLETIRHYAQEQLVTSNESQNFQARHRDWYLRQAEEAQQYLSQLGTRLLSWLDQCEIDHEDILAALRWSKQQAEWEVLTRFCLALQPFWCARRHLSEGRHWFEACLNHSQQFSVLLQGQILYSLGYLAILQSDYTYALAQLQKSLDYSTQSDDDATYRNTLHCIGLAMESRGEYEQAKALYRQSLSLAQEQTKFGEIAIISMHLGTIAMKQAEEENAWHYYKESLLACQQMDNQHGEASVLHNMGYLALAQKDYEKSIHFLARSYTLFQRLEDKIGMAIATGNLGRVALYQQQYQHACQQEQESLRLSWALQFTVGIAEALETFAAIAATQQNFQYAAHLWGAAEGFRNQRKLPHEPFDLLTYTNQVEAARTRADTQLFQQAWKQGRQQPVDEIVLSLLTPSDSNTLLVGLR